MHYLLPIPYFLPIPPTLFLGPNPPPTLRLLRPLHTNSGVLLRPPFTDSPFTDSKVHCLLLAHPFAQQEPIEPFTSHGHGGIILRVALVNFGAILLLGALLGPLQLTLRRAAARAAAAGAIGGVSSASGLASGGVGMTFLTASSASTLLLGVNLIYGGLLVNALAWLVLPTARRLRLFGANMAVRRRNFWRKRLARHLLRPPGECDALRASQCVLPAVSPLCTRCVPAACRRLCAVGCLLPPCLLCLACGVFASKQAVSRCPHTLAADTASGRGLQRRLKAAESLRLRGRQSVGQEEVSYSTAKLLIEQSEAHNPLMEGWDCALQSRAGRPAGGGGAARKRKDRGARLTVGAWLRRWVRVST